MSFIGIAKKSGRIEVDFGAAIELHIAFAGEFAFSAPDSVAFDVAVTAKHAGSARGGFKIQVFSIGANAGGDVSSEASTVSRIQFTIPTKFKRDREVRHDR